MMFEEIKKLLVEFACVSDSDVTENSKLKEDLGIDSLYAVELILELETAFDIKIEWEEMKPLQTVNDVVKLVEAKRG